MSSSRISVFVFFWGGGGGTWSTGWARLLGHLVFGGWGLRLLTSSRGPLIYRVRLLAITSSLLCLSFLGGPLIYRLRALAMTSSPLCLTAPWLIAGSSVKTRRLSSTPVAWSGRRGCCVGGLVEQLWRLLSRQPRASRRDRDVWWCSPTPSGITCEELPYIHTYIYTVVQFNDVGILCSIV